MTTTHDRQVLADYPTYDQAQRLVDQLSDTGFPVERLRIAGEGVRTVEQVTGRRTKGRAAAAGAASGAWFGLLVGLLITLFSDGAAALLLLVTSAAIGALWGAVFGFAAHAATSGHRDFSSIHRLEADRYLVEVDAEYAARAGELAVANHPEELGD